jgi:hypothetical protein
MLSNSSKERCSSDRNWVELHEGHWRFNQITCGSQFGLIQLADFIVSPCDKRLFL